MASGIAVSSSARFEVRRERVNGRSLGGWRARLPTTLPRRDSFLATTVRGGLPGRGTSGTARYGDHRSGPSRPEAEGEGRVAAAKLNIRRAHGAGPRR